MNEEVTLTLPSSPGVVVVFPPALVTKLTNLEGCLNDRCLSEKEANHTSYNLNVANALEKEIEAARVEAKRPYLEAGKAIDAAAKSPLERVGEAKRKLKAKLSTWQSEQDRILREEEARVKAEQARLREEAEEAARAAEAARQAIEEQRKQDESEAHPAGDDEDDAFAAMAAEAEVERLVLVAADKAVAAAVAPVVVIAAKPVGVVFRETLEVEVVDLAKVPEVYLTRSLKVADVKRDHCTGWKSGLPLPVVPGLRFVLNRQPVTR